jgi:amino acid permease
VVFDYLYPDDACKFVTQPEDDRNPFSIRKYLDDFITNFRNAGKGQCFILVIVFQYLIRQPHVMSTLPTITNFDGILMASGSILYSFEGQAMVLPMENRLKHPKKMLGPFGVLSQGMFLVTLVYASCGFFGYVSFKRFQ